MGTTNAAETNHTMSLTLANSVRDALQALVGGNEKVCTIHVYRPAHPATKPKLRPRKQSQPIDDSQQYANDWRIRVVASETITEAVDIIIDAKDEKFQLRVGPVVRRIETISIHDANAPHQIAAEVETLLQEFSS